MIPAYFADATVEAESVTDFLRRYYKPERYTGRGKEYAASLLTSYQREYETRGYTFISQFESVTGALVVFSTAL